MIKKKDLNIITILFLISRLFFLVFLLQNKTMNIFDSISYISIADKGYFVGSLFAFFPLYPLLMKLLHFIIPSYLASGIIISNICAYLSAIIIYLIIEKKEFKIIGVILLIYSPILGFNMICYSESLYLLLTLLSFYFYKKNKLLTGIFVGLAMLTRNSGIILLGAYGLDLLIKWFKKEEVFKQILIFAIPAILIGSLFSIYLYQKTNDPFKYLTSQKTDWNKDSSNMITVMIKDINYMKENKNMFVFYLFLQNWIIFYLALFYSIKYIKKEFAIAIYTIVSLIAFTITCRNGTWNSLASISIFRYVLSLFPIYLFHLMSNKKYAYTITYISVILSVINTIALFSHAFIA